MTNQYTSFRFQIPSDSFTNVPGALLNFYEAGTLNRVTVYADAGLMTPLSNPVEADGFGLFPSIFLVPDDYDIVATDENDVQIWANEDYTVADVPVLDPNYFSLINGEYVPGIAVNTQTGTGYSIINDDRAAIITFNNNAGGTITLPAPSGSNFPNKWFTYISNIGTGTFILGSSANINGAATFTLGPNSFTLVVSNGSTYSAGAAANYDQIFTKPGGTLTIASGIVTAGAFSEYIIDTESGASTDNLDTINGVSDGKELVLRSLADARDVVIKHNTGNIYNPAGQDITLGTRFDTILLRYDSTLVFWIVQAYSTIGTKLPLITSSFTSTDQAITFGTAVSLAHSLGVVPKIYNTFLICVTNDGEFVVGDIVEIGTSQGPSAGGGTNTGFVKYLSTTNCSYRFSSGGYLMINKTSGTNFGITAANWNVRVIAYA